MQATPFLTFQPATGSSAAEAMIMYVELFDDGQILFEQRRGLGDFGDEGTIFLAEFIVAGQKFRCSDSALTHEWNFSPAISLWIDCPSIDEQQRLFTALAVEGREHMPLGDYGFGPFGWVQDRFGVNWQLAAPA
ncbi:putative 3-demethylubiquinone-9 3-methyltransferase (glyoxalase superfamily) [Arthrobacter sp. PL16]|uniref:VOC family protein n=1 Tax=Arthrobacter sp. PL16 TaxID=3071720 RepID=UPI002E019A6D|nr:putative 3-demethylubiquinone-9 3-methyltransferase (glyoxalase superfamily) [Arthrobacter sp. PL16]